MKSGNASVIWCRMFYFPVCYKNVNIKIQIIINFFAALYGCETLSLILREERRLRVFENRVLRKVFLLMWDVVTGEWWKLHINPLNPELNPICYLLALLGAHHFLHVSRIRVKLSTFRLLSYIYIYIYMEYPFLMFLDHTQRRTTVGRTPLDEW